MQRLNGVFSLSSWKSLQKRRLLKILKGLRPYYEKHHGVEILDEALEAAVKMSVRYINDRFFRIKPLTLLMKQRRKYSWRDIVRLRKQKHWKERSTIF